MDNGSSGWERIAMASNSHIVTFTIRKRSWWHWSVAGLWLLIELVFLQTSIASMREDEMRAAGISGTVAAVLLAAATSAWFLERRSRGREGVTENDSQGRQ